MVSRVGSIRLVQFYQTRSKLHRRQNYTQIAKAKFLWKFQQNSYQNFKINWPENYIIIILQPITKGSFKVDIAELWLVERWENFWWTSFGICISYLNFALENYGKLFWSFLVQIEFIPLHIFEWGVFCGGNFAIAWFKIEQIIV